MLDFLKDELKFKALQLFKALNLPSLRYYPSKEISLKELIEKGTSPSIKYLENNEDFILTLPNGRVWSSNGTVVTEDNFFIREINRNSIDESRNIIFYQKSVIPPTKIAGSAAVVAVPWGTVYYHWMVDVLPRLELLKEAGLLESIDYLVVNEIRADFQLEVLNRLGIPLSKTIQAKSIWQTHYQFDQLIVPSFASEPNQSSLLTIKAVEKSFPSTERITLKKNFHKKIYLGRSKAPNRKLINESEILPFLIKQGFEEIYPENYTVSEQAEIFRNAEVIVGVHGSAFTNIIFCRQNTKVIDICAPEWINNCFSSISKIKGLNYFRIVGNRYLRKVTTNKGSDVILEKAQIDSLHKLLI